VEERGDVGGVRLILEEPLFCVNLVRGKVKFVFSFCDVNLTCSSGEVKA
jgi:hypothetical protein